MAPKPPPPPPPAGDGGRRASEIPPAPWPNQNPERYYNPLPDDFQVKTHKSRISLRPGSPGGPSGWMQLIAPIAVLGFGAAMTAYVELQNLKAENEHLKAAFADHVREEKGRNKDLVDGLRNDLRTLQGQQADTRVEVGKMSTMLERLSR